MEYKMTESKDTLSVNLDSLSKSAQLIKAQAQCVTDKCGEIQRLLKKLSEIIGEEESKRLFGQDAASVGEISRRAFELNMFISCSLENYTRSDTRCKEIIKELAL